MVGYYGSLMNLVPKNDIRSKDQLFQKLVKCIPGRFHAVLCSCGGGSGVHAIRKCRNQSRGQSRVPIMNRQDLRDVSSEYFSGALSNIITPIPIPSSLYIHIFLCSFALNWSLGARPELRSFSVLNTLPSHTPCSASQPGRAHLR